MILVPDKKIERGLRIDIFLKNHLPEFSRMKLKNLIKEGMVRVDGAVTKPSYRLMGGERIFVEIPEPPLQKEILPEPLPLKIYYQDPFIAVVEKEAGIPVHPAYNIYSGTLVNALLFHFDTLSSIGGESRRGIVHRLDKETSGLMVIARTDSAHLSLIGQFSRREVKKEYDVIVWGEMKDDCGVISKPIGRGVKTPVLMSVRTRYPKIAETRWKVVERFGVATHLKVFPKTGRTHQIRVHLSFVGHPVMGDKRYSSVPKHYKLSPELIDLSSSLTRHLLHASRLAFTHPGTGEVLEFSSSLPEVFGKVIDALRNFKGKGR